MNEDANLLEGFGSYKAGLYFVIVQNIMEHYCNGIQLAIVKVSGDEEVYVEDKQFR